jgi:quinol-cytochrome oxidoreductase complex cytochrome b subunit
MLYRKVPKGTNWFYTLGSATLFAFIVQATTGVFLAMFYTPSTTQAYASIAHINNDVFLGAFVHGMHKWGSSVMVILIFLHMGRTFFFGAYKYPRELNWVIGVVLLILTMTMAFTGYLLPFDQRSFWASVVGININGTGPVLGPYLSDFLRAGPELGATTLSRFYAIHMLLLPGAIIALIGAHLYLVVKLGTTAPPWLRAEKPKNAMPARQLDAGVEGNGASPTR